jgi:branched-chain amino acid transport system substrate-binding protein
MRRKSAIGAVLIAVALVASACGDDDNDTAATTPVASEDTSAAPTATDAAPDATDAAPDATDAPAAPVDKPEVAVGALAPITGGNSVFAQHEANSIELGVDEYNASATGKCKINLTTYDNLGTAEDSTRVAQRAITVDSAQALIGTFASAEALAVKEIAERQKIIFISTTGISNAVTQDATYTFRTSAKNDDYPVSMAALIKRLGLSKPAIIHDDGPVGSSLAGPVADMLVSEGFTVAGSVEYALNATDLSANMQQIADLGADSLLLLSSSGADSGLVIKTEHEQGLTLPIMGFSSIGSPDAQTVAGDAFDSIDVYSFFNRDPAKPEYIAFHDAYEAKYGAEANLAEQAAPAYDGVKVLGAALDATDCSTDGAELAEAIHALPPIPAASGPVGGEISFTDTQDGHGSLEVPPFKIVDGVPTPVV